MSIIYSYPSVEPALDDLIIGTDVGADNATKSFTVESLVTLANAQAGNGTVTGVTILTDVFLSAFNFNPGARNVTWSLGLSATGTPSENTFLRGDNKWITPTVSAGISVQQNGLTLTSDVSRFNFTGTGVSVTANASGIATVSIDPAPSDITSINQGAGISVSSTTGDVIISNSGVTQLTTTGELTLTNASGVAATSGALVLGIGTLTTGTVTSVSPGNGLKLDSGAINLDPTIGIQYSTKQNFIETAVAINGYFPNKINADSIFIFNENDADGNKVYGANISDIPIAALPLVEADIDAKVLDVVKNNTDLLPEVAKVVNIISLLQSTYSAAGFTPVANTLYLTTSDAPEETGSTVLAVNTNAITGPTSGWNLQGDAIGAARSGTAGTPISPAYLTTIQLATGYQWATEPTITNYTGNFPTLANSPETVTSTASTGVVELIPQASNGSTLNTAFTNNFPSSIVAADFTTAFNTQTPTANVATGNINESYNPTAIWAVDYTANNTEKYTLVKSATVYTPSSPSYDGTGVNAKLQGTWTLRNYDATYVITDNIDGDGSGLNSKYIITINSPWNSSYSGTPEIKAFGFGTTVSFGVNVTAIGNNTVNPSFAYVGDRTRTIGASGNTFGVIISGTTGSNQGSFTFNQFTNSIEGPAAGYNVGTTNWEISGQGNNVITEGQTQTAAINSLVTISQLGLAVVQPGFTVLAGSPLIATINPTNFNVTASRNFDVVLSGKVITARKEILIGALSSAVNVCSTSPGVSTVFLAKGSGNTGDDVQQGDTLFITADGETNYVANGFYKATVAGEINSYIQVKDAVVSIAATCLPTQFKISLNNLITAPSGALTVTLQYKKGLGGNYITITPNQSYTALAGDQIYTRCLFSLSGNAVVEDALNFTPKETVALVVVQSQTVERTIELTGELYFRVQSAYDFDSLSPQQSEACLSNPGSISNTMFLRKVTLSSTNSTPQTGDQCFTTATGGAVLAPNGYYLIGLSPKKWMQISGNGVIGSTGNC